MLNKKLSKGVMPCFCEVYAVKSERDVPWTGIDKRNVQTLCKLLVRIPQTEGFCHQPVCGNPGTPLHRRRANQQDLLKVGEKGHQGVGVCTYPLVNVLARKVGKKPMLLGACITYVLLYGAINCYRFVISMIGGPAFAILIGLVIAMPIAVTNIIPASMFTDLAQYDTIKTGENRAGMFLAARNFANKLCQSFVVVVCALLLGKGVDGTDSATSEGVQATALVAMLFVGCALFIYFFYNDGEISETIRKANEENQ